jgi:hypothetical protein
MEVAAWLVGRGPEVLADSLHRHKECMDNLGQWAVGCRARGWQAVEMPTKTKTSGEWHSYLSDGTCSDMSMCRTIV